MMSLSEIVAYFTKDLKTMLAEIFYIIIGIVFLLNGIKALKDDTCKKRYTTATFWFLVALTFIAGPYIPKWFNGLCVVAMAVIAAMGGVVQSKSDVPTASETRANANKLGYMVFIPAVCLAVTAVLVATFWNKEIGANNAVGISAAVALVVAMLLFKSQPKYIVKDSTRLLDNVGITSLLPQVLAALGALFTAAGVGEVISGAVSNIIPDGSRFLAVVVYCVAMALFTIIMGNGFAAFSVITVGIGIPFLIAQGANPIVVGALGLTAGYCGTLVTPMAANFNIMPAALLETKSKYAIIFTQLPVAITMLVIHILLMYFLAF